MDNKISKEELTNIIKIYKIFNDDEILIMINDPDLISDVNIKNSLIKLINLENNVLDKIKYYFDEYNNLTGGKGRRRKRKKSKRKKKRSKKKRSKKNKSKKKKLGRNKNSKKKKSKKKKSKDKELDEESDQFSEESNVSSENVSRRSGNVSSENVSRRSNNLSPDNFSTPVIGNNRLSGFSTGIPNITINNNNNNGSQTIDDKNIPQVSIPLKFVINKEGVSKNVKSDKKGGRNIELNKSNGLDILKKSLDSGETEFNLTFDLTKDINYENKEYSEIMNNVKSLVKKKVVDVANNKNVPQFKNELKEKITSINNLLPPFYSQDIVLP